MIGKAFLFFVLHLSLPVHAFLVDELTIEEQVGQLLMPCFLGETANEDAKYLIQNIQVGGILYYNWTNGLSSPQQVRELSQSLQDLAQANRLPIPLLLSVDQEGGVVSRLKGNGFTVFPGNRALAMMGDPTLAKQQAFAMGKEMQNVGISLNLAPVVDVDSNPNNPVISARSFGKDVETVITFAKKSLEGYREAGVATTLKHFPGHGDTDIDSHYALPIVNKSMQELQKTELAPFAALAHDTEAIMTAHLLVPALDPDHCSTLSQKTLSYLREQIGFSGLIISDSLTMDGLLQQTAGRIEEAAILAIQAGCDMLLFGGRRLQGSFDNHCLSTKEIQNIHIALVSAVKNGDIPEERIHQAVERVLQLKAGFKSQLVK